MAAYQNGITHRASGENDRDRALLFGRQYTQAGGVVRPAGSSIVASSEREMMESRNGMMVDGLMGRVGQIRDIAIDIGEEVRTQNEFISGMGGNFEAMSGALGDTMRKLKHLSASASGSHMLVLAAFAFGFFILVWWLFPR